MVVLLPRERVQQIFEEDATMPARHDPTKAVEVMMLLPQERVQQRTGAHAPVSQFWNETVEGGAMDPNRVRATADVDRLVQQILGMKSMPKSLNREA